MNTKRIGLAAFGLMLGLTFAAARADDAPKIDNPLFVAWSKFDTGASATAEGDITTPDGQKMHVTGTDTLKEKNADNVKIDSVGQVGDHKDDPKTDTIPAKIAPDAAVKKGEEDVKVMDKTYKCTVYEMTAAAMGDEGDMKATCYISNEVPGGVVKAVLHAPDGKDYTFVLTSVKEK
jgi:hypothetical protein